MSNLNSMQLIGESRCLRAGNNPVVMEYSSASALVNVHLLAIESFDNRLTIVREWFLASLPGLVTLVIHAAGRILRIESYQKPSHEAHTPTKQQASNRNIQLGQSFDKSQSMRLPVSLSLPNRSMPLPTNLRKLGKKAIKCRRHKSRIESHYSSKLCCTPLITNILL
jgi:hypothetical protein